MSDQFELCAVCRMANHRELVRLTDFEIENAELRAEVERLQEKLSGEVGGLTEMVRFNQESGQYDDTFNPLIKEDK